MRIILLIVLSFYFLNVYSQDTKKNRNYPANNAAVTKSHFDKIELKNKNIEQFIADELSFSSENIELKHAIKSLAGMHYTYIQKHKNIPILHSQIKINTDTTNHIISWFDNSYPVSEKSTLFPDSTLVIQYIKDRFHNSCSILMNKIWYAETDGLVGAYQLISHNPITSESLETIIGPDGLLLEETDLNRYLHSVKDTTATAMIFNPDPLTTSNTNYGGNYKDNNDTDPSGFVNAERKQVLLKCIFENDTFRLKSPWAEIINVSMPDDSIFYSKNNIFDFNRSHPFFEDVNAYFHIHTFQEYIRSLGFTNLASYPIHIDTHSLMGSDNSSFISTTPIPQLLFGEGGVDDAEDADVVIHEYTHAITFSASPNTVFGNERNAIEEGCGDYFAASYSRSINNNQWNKVFTWDGHNEFWSGRNANSSKTYPASISGDYHSDGEIWASALMNVWGKIGRDKTDKLLLESSYSFASGMRLCDAAKLFLQSDSVLYNYSNKSVIYQTLDSYGLFHCFKSGNNIHKIQKNSEIQYSNELEFMHGNGQLKISLQREFYNHTYSIEVYNLSGVKINELPGNNETLFFLSPELLKSGFYVLKISSENKTATKKLIRF